MVDRYTVFWRAGILVILGLTSGAFIGSNDDGGFDAEEMLDAAVSIRTVSHVSTDAVGDSVWASSTGSGFLVSAERCEVWTNHHVIDNAAVIEVWPRGWRRSTGIPAAVLHATPRGDFAILALRSCEGMRAARLGDSSRSAVGDESYAVGNPLGNNPDSISRGIISHIERFVAAI